MDRRLLPAPVWLAGIGLLWLAYLLLFIAASPARLGAAVVDAAVNVLPLLALTPGIDWLVRARLLGRPTRLQAALLAAAAPLFAFCWYGGILVLQALQRALEGGRLEIIGFSGLGLGWQMFQGLVLYAAVAGIAYARAFAAVGAARGEGNAPPPLERYLTRIGDAIAPVDVADIVSISGAQDYSEVATAHGRHLARLSLGEFERRLDPARFIRIHRSAIINLARLERAEPAGNGRLTVLLHNGDSLQTSRAGARRLRELLY
ncbi:MAG TPA: LytTR family DNA-binding domain-containing protein [Allosphingosinicella sp.]|nr:LytTR family DNA-binding domain-containing protein [Allosphingosinicella sp.]